LAVGVSTLAVVHLLLGSLRLGLPSASGFVTFPARRELPIVFAVLAVGTLNSRMSAFDLNATVGVRRAKNLILALASVYSVAAVMLAESLATGPASGVVYARSVVISIGLALLSGRLWGWGFAWILPIATIFPTVYYGRDALNVVRWWDWTSQPASFPLAWLEAVVSLAIGLTAYWLTPWRRRRIAAWLRQRP
jgi:hypothetical protein